MKDQDIKQRIRDAFDHMAPDMPGTAPVIRTAREEPAPARPQRHPALSWAMAAAAAVVVFFCGFAVLHGWESRPGSGLAASQIPMDTVAAATASPTPERTQPALTTTVPAPRTQAPTAVAAAAPREPTSPVAKAVPTDRPSSTQDDLLGEEEVIAIVLQHAEVEKEEAQQWFLRLDREDGRLIYEADFIAGDTDFDYEIDAYTGEILQSERELRSYRQQSAPQAREVDRDKALALALENAGVQADRAQKVKVETDREDGQAVYEVEFVSDGVKFEYEIDAATGEILQSEREKVQTTRNSTAKPKATAKPSAKASGSSSTKTTDTAIGKDDALSAALRNAGVSSEDAGRVKVEKDREDGRTIYEVEFKADGYEYEYEIDAATGQVLKKEKERDDD